MSDSRLKYPPQSETGSFAHARKRPSSEKQPAMEQESPRKLSTSTLTILRAKQQPENFADDSIDNAVISPLVVESAPQARNVSNEIKEYNKRQKKKRASIPEKPEPEVDLPLVKMWMCFNCKIHNAMHCSKCRSCSRKDGGNIVLMQMSSGQQQTELTAKSPNGSKTNSVDEVKKHMTAAVHQSKKEPACQLGRLAKDQEYS